MQTITLYRYTRPDGGVSTSPIKPDAGDYSLKYRLIADEGKLLTDGTTVAGCVDVESPEGWTETDAPEDGDVMSEDAQYAEAGKILLGVSK